MADLEDIGGTTASASKQRKGHKGVSTGGVRGAAVQGCKREEEVGRGGAMEKGSGSTSGAPREMVTPVLRQSLTKQGQFEWQV